MKESLVSLYLDGNHFDLEKKRDKIEQLKKCPDKPVLLKPVDSFAGVGDEPV